MTTIPKLSIILAMTLTLTGAGSLACRAAEQPAAIDSTLGPAIEAADLANSRARGDDGSAADPANSAAVTGNTVTGVETGVATIRDSINNNSGFTTVFQNTGNNVLFQSSTVVNITVR